MIWWDWKASQRVPFVAAMLVVAAVLLMLFGGFAGDWRALLGGTAFLFIPQIVAWLLFVGLATGRMPSAYGRSELRDESPKWFWITGAGYAALVLFFIWIIVGVVLLGF
ncbi:MAG TPA: hypothetical protein VFH89_09005 [Sphingomicrobium sp.]|nr:hypothetical protein [Sphingomicrobium sp.]